MEVEASHCVRLGRKLCIARSIPRNPDAAALCFGNRAGRGELELYRPDVAQAVSGVVMKLVSSLTCPACGHRSVEKMLTDACQFFYECKGCGALLKPKADDCCALCSDGDVPCLANEEQESVDAPPHVVPVHRT